MLIGYTRVATADHGDDLQRRALIDAGVPPEEIFSDIVPGAVTGRTRPGLARALARAQEGDVLVVWRLDRLGRSVVDVLNVVEHLVGRGVGLMSLSDGIDPTTTEGRAVLGHLGGLARYERDLLSERVREGMAAARRRGSRLGRPAPDPDEVASKVRTVQRLIGEGSMSVTDAAASVGWSRSTYYRHQAAMETVAP